MKTLLLLLGVSTVLLLNGCASNPSASFAAAKQSFQQQNYETAYQQVLVPAQKGNPQAQYALGYMYYYGKGTPMNHVLGKYWIRKAAIAGDQNAISAIQMILSQEQNIMDSTPASQQPSVTEESQLPENDTLSHVHVVKKALPEPHHKPLVHDRPVAHIQLTGHYNANEKTLLARKANRYAVQLLDASQIHYAQSFVRRHNLGRKANIYHRRLNGKSIYVVVYGDFANRANAKAAIKKLPKSVQELKPWIRTYSGIQTEIRNSDG